MAGSLFGGGCGTAEPPGDDGQAVLTIEQALATKPDNMLKVRGAVVATGSDVVLASALLESYPPQAGGPILPLKGLDLDSLVGLSSTAAQPDLAQVMWSEYWLTLEGTIEDGVLQVERVPRVVEESFEGMRIRFSPVSEPVVAGGAVWWAFDVKNVGSAPMDLIFTSGQRGEVILAQDGVDKYRWSAGKFFTEAIETVALEPGKALSVAINDVPDVAPGDYELRASVTASVGPSGTGGSGGPGQALPELTTSIRVY